jgi:hypothetical protein
VWGHSIVVGVGVLAAAVIEGASSSTGGFLEGIVDKIIDKIIREFSEIIGRK